MSTCRTCGAHVDHDVLHRDWHRRQDVDLRFDLVQSIMDAQLKRIEQLEREQPA